MYNLPITTACIATFNKTAYEQLEAFETKVLALAKEAWAGQMSKLLRLMLRCRHRYGDKLIPQHQASRLERIYDTIVEQALPMI